MMYTLIYQNQKLLIISFFYTYFEQMQASSIPIQITIFIVTLRNALSRKNLTIEQFFRNFKRVSPQSLSNIQFSSIVKSIQPNLNTLQISSLTEKLKINGNIPIQHFINLYHRVVKNIPETKKVQEKKIQISELDRMKIKLGTKKLAKFIIDNEPDKLFNQCDLDQSNTLNVNQFYKLIMCADVQQFKNKNIAKLFINSIFKYYPNKQMNKQQYYSLFKLDKIPPLKKHDHSVNVQHIKIQEVPKNKSVQKKSVTPIKNIIPESNPMKKKQQAKLIPIIPPEEKRVIIPEMNNQLCNNIQVLFPHAFKYYRLGLPSENQLPIFESLQSYLQAKKDYIDKNNPATHKGVYKSAKQFFPNLRYHLFQVAQSVFYREKSRIGVARQIQPKDIIQGEIGDCYFLSSIASLVSLYPETVSQRFLFKQNEAGMFAVKLFIDGEWVIFKTDDRFPTNEYGKP